MQELCAVDVFYGSKASGNRHHIAYRKAPPWSEIPKEYQQVSNLILTSGESGALSAQFFNYGRPVRRCGSGNLAVAEYINDKLTDTPYDERLLTPEGEVQLGFDRRSAYYLDKPLAQWQLPNLGLWRRLARQPIINGCYCGSRNDYVLLEVGQPLTKFNLNSSALCRFSQRALIVVYRRPSGGLQLRYFAPQYGPTEDAATGSASVQAVAYLRRQYPGRYGNQQIEVEQCSPAGGWLYLKNYRQYELVRGRTSLATKTGRCFYGI